MNQTGLIVAVLGIGAAGFLYWRSQQQQAAALAAAAAAPGPGLLQKAENSAKEAAAVALHAGSAVTSPVRSVVSSVSSGVSSIFGGGSSSGGIPGGAVIDRLKAAGGQHGWRIPAGQV